MPRIHAYLHFDGDCREAMTFYEDSLGGELTLQTVAESPMADDMPTEAGDRILHASLMKDELVLMASDYFRPEEFTRGTGTALSLDCDSEAQGDAFFTSLSSNGEVVEPLSEAPWGATFGMLVDKFGVEWMVSYDESGAE